MTRCARTVRRLARIALLLGIAAAGCARPVPSTDDVALAWTLEPAPPQVGPATLTVALRDSTGGPLPGAQVAVEGNMSHPGMQPVLATATETAPGQYTAPLTLTMAGDWFILITAALPDGRTLKRQIDVPGVRTP